MNKKRYYLGGNLLIILLLLISTIVWHRVYKVYSVEEEKNLSVTFLNVWQGDSILIKTPNKKYILIDGGTTPKEWSNFDAGKNVIVPYLKQNGIGKLDLVIATHPDLDHIGGLISVLNNIKTDMFLDSGTISTTQTYESLLKLIEDKQILYKIAQKGEFQIDPAINMEILSPLSDRFKDDPNNNSVLIKLTYNKISFLFTADIQDTAESIYAQKYGDKLSSTILKVSHHGGKKSSSLKFLNYVQPEVAVISCGKNNPFGHPSKQVLERLKQICAIIYRTDENGNITIKTDGEKYTVLTQK